METTATSDDLVGDAYIDAKADDRVALLRDPRVQRQLRLAEPIELWDLCRGFLRDVQRDPRDHFASSVQRATAEPCPQRQEQRDREREARRSELNRTPGEAA